MPLTLRFENDTLFAWPDYQQLAIAQCRYVEHRDGRACIYGIVQHGRGGSCGAQPLVRRRGSFDGLFIGALQVRNGIGDRVSVDVPLHLQGPEVKDKPGP